MAEGFLRELFRSRVGEGEPIEVSSAGTSGWDGSPATPEAVDAAADRDTDIASHRARRLLEHHLEDADLVIGMTGEHRERSIRLVPPVAPRTFTLKELVRLLEAVPPQAAADPATGAADRLRARVAEADALRIDGFRGNAHDEDVVDPIGLSADTYRAVAWELDGLCQRLVDGLLGTSPAPTSLASMWNEGE